MASMTLAFDGESLSKLEDPAAVFEDARGWASYVGVVSDGMAYQVVNHIRELGIYNEDFFSRMDRQKSLEHAAERTDTDRHVFLGTSAEDEDIAETAGWEYLDVREAAAKAGWELADDGEPHAPGVRESDTRPGQKHPSTGDGR